jgi:hypothetical protein
MNYFPFETYNASILQVAREARWLGYEPRIISLHVIATFRGAANDVSTPGLPGLRSTQRKPGGAQGSGIGLNTRHIAAEPGLEPCVNREIWASHDKLLGSLPGFLNAARRPNPGLRA